VNGKQPVQSLFVVPGTMSPNGLPSIVAELNRNDGGTGGMTVNRTDRPNDTIDFVPVNSALAHKIFGSAYGEGRWAALRMLRAQLQEEPGTTGRTDPTRSVTGAQGNQTVDVSEGEVEGPDAGVEVDTSDAREGPPDPALDLMLPHIQDESELNQPRSHFQPAEPPSRGDLPPADLRNRTRAQGDRGPAIDTTATTNRGSQGMNPASEPEQSFWPEGTYDAVAAGIRDAATPFEPLGTSLRRTGEAIGHIWNSIPTTAKALQATGVPPSTIKEGAQGGNKEAQEEVGTPADNQQAQQAAQVVMQPVRGRTPSLIQQYNAIGLKNLGVINEEQLMRYAKTGSFDPEAEEKVVNLGDGRATLCL
jgi:hypothetical protein